MESKNFNEELKKMESANSLAEEEIEGGRLDDTQRVKVLSPGQLIFKRFIRNKLAIVGSAILAFMFAFCFLGPVFYPYHQTQKFYKTDILKNADFAAAQERTEYSTYKIDTEHEVHYSVLNMINLFINNMKADNQEYLVVKDNFGESYVISYEADNIYSLNKGNLTNVGTYTESQLICEYDLLTQKLTYSQGITMDESFGKTAETAITGGVTEFEYNGKTYNISSAGIKKYAVRSHGESAISYTAGSPGEGFLSEVQAALDKGIFEYQDKMYSVSLSSEGIYDIDSFTVGDMYYITSPYSINMINGSSSLSNEYILEALISSTTDNIFEYDGTVYEVRKLDDTLYIYRGEESEPYALFTTFSVSRSSGMGTLPLQFKDDVHEKILEMIEQNISVAPLITKVEKQVIDGSIELDDDGNIIYADTEVIITRKGENYSITCDRYKYLIDRYSGMFSGSSGNWHVFGTDGDGFDVLSRMMFGGQISLVVGFVVVIIEIILGIIMGGISGYFGGWIDTLVMRIVEVFYCIPSLPIMIILGALFDAEQMNPYVRLMWLMAVLGFLGWASVARLVRGQILSLREQEFMLATEVGGLRVSRRIFRHLIPNVMPQLIVTATAGLGSVILLESTLSFLGLGVKHPLATWGSMINSVSDYNSMVNYAYIWVPVGLLICLTVIAFNFVGDGLRDAFDPKMKR